MFPPDRDAPHPHSLPVPTRRRIALSRANTPARPVDLVGHLHTGTETRYDSIGVVRVTSSLGHRRSSHATGPRHAHQAAIGCTVKLCQSMTTLVSCAGLDFLAAEQAYSRFSPSLCSPLVVDRIGPAMHHGPGPRLRPQRHPSLRQPQRHARVRRRPLHQSPPPARWSSRPRPGMMEPPQSLRTATTPTRQVVGRRDLHQHSQA
jgi:hypothetical protein